jgi:hypothetical protein
LDDADRRQLLSYLAATGAALPGRSGKLPEFCSRFGDWSVQRGLPRLTHAATARSIQRKNLSPA